MQAFHFFILVYDLILILGSISVESESFELCLNRVFLLASLDKSFEWLNTKEKKCFMYNLFFRKVCLHCIFFPIFLDLVQCIYVYIFDRKYILYLNFMRGSKWEVRILFDLLGLYDHFNDYFF